MTPTVKIDDDKYTPAVKILAEKRFGRKLADGEIHLTLARPAIWKAHHLPAMDAYAWVLEHENGSLATLQSPNEDSVPIKWNIRADGLVVVLEQETFGIPFAAVFSGFGDAWALREAYFESVKDDPELSRFLPRKIPLINEDELIYINGKYWLCEEIERIGHLLMRGALRCIDLGDSAVGAAVERMYPFAQLVQKFRAP